MLDSRLLARSRLHVCRFSYSITVTSRLFCAPKSKRFLYLLLFAFVLYTLFIKIMPSFVKNAAGSRCSLAYCTSLSSNNSDEIHISFFGFPKDCSRCASWVEKCEARYLPTADLDVLHKTYKLCSLHFETKMFKNNLKNRLTQTAIPTLFARKPSSSLSIISGNVSVSTSTEQCEATTGSKTPGHLSLKTPRKVTLRKKLAKAYTTIKKLENDVIRLSVCLEQSDTITNSLQLVEKCAKLVEKCNVVYLPTLNVSDLSNRCKLCSLHFENKMFSNLQKNKLFPHALPTLRLVKLVQKQLTGDTLNIPHTLDESAKSFNINGSNIDENGKLRRAVQQLESDIPDTDLNTEINSKMKVMLGMYNQSTLNVESQQNIIKYCDKILSIITKESIESTDNEAIKYNNVKNIEKPTRFLSKDKKSPTTYPPLSSIESNLNRDSLKNSSGEVLNVHSSNDHSYYLKKTWHSSGEVLNVHSSNDHSYYLKKTWDSSGKVLNIHSLNDHSYYLKKI